MANITTTADFIGQNNIPDKIIYSDDLNWFINKYEPILLTKLLGSDLYTLLKQSPTDARFVSIIEPFLHPACIDFIYWYYLEDQFIQLTSLGASQSKKENATTVSPKRKMVRAWNEMVELNRKLHKFFVDNAVTYPEYTTVFPMWFFDGWIWGEWRPHFGVDEIYMFQNRVGI